jgi:hypothetical protein
MELKNYLEQVELMMRRGKHEHASKFYEWVLMEGRKFDKKDMGELTAEEKHLVDSIKPRVRPKQCYYVNQLLATSDKRVKYWEGWVIDKRVLIPLEHSWVTINGKVVDLVCEKIKSEPVEYFGVQVPTSFVAKNMLRTGVAQDVLSRFYFSEVEKSKSKLKSVV